jgi:hypothetical protein
MGTDNSRILWWHLLGSLLLAKGFSVWPAEKLSFCSARENARQLKFKEFMLEAHRLHVNRRPQTAGGRVDGGRGGCYKIGFESAA